MDSSRNLDRGVFAPRSIMLSDNERELQPAEYSSLQDPIHDDQLLPMPLSDPGIMTFNLAVPCTLPSPDQASPTSLGRLGTTLAPCDFVSGIQTSSLYPPDPIMADESAEFHQLLAKFTSPTPLEQAAEASLLATSTTLPLHQKIGILPLSVHDADTILSGSATLVPQLPAVGPHRDEARMPNPLRPGTSRPSREDWVMHKAEIKRLYLEENNTLPEVMAIMGEKHNFNAT